MIDSKGRLFGKVSIIDIVIVIIIITSVTGAFYRYTKTKIAGPFNTENVITTFFIEEVPDYVAQSIKKGDRAVSKLRKNDLGEIAVITIDKSVSWSHDDKGQIVKSTKTGYNSLELKVESRGVYSEGGLVLNGVDYFAGQKLFITVGKYEIGEMTITDMRKKE